MTAQEAKEVFEQQKAQGYTDDDILGVLYLMFQDDRIDLQTLEELIDVLGYEFTPEFKAMSPEDQKVKGLEQTEDKADTNVDNCEKDVIPNQYIIKGLDTASFDLSGINLSGKLARNEIPNSQKN